MQAGYIRSGAIFYATIRSNGNENIITGPDGQNIPFTCSIQARKAAQRRIDEAAKPAPIEVIAVDETPQLVREWREQRLAEQRKLSDMGTLIGVEVVRKRRFRNGAENATGRIDR